MSYTPPTEIHYAKLKKIQDTLQESASELNYLWYCITSEIDDLTECAGETFETMEKVQMALDFNFHGYKKEEECNPSKETE